jgi:hypothetical protein
MSTSKTIKINPELFKVSGRRSRKNGEAKPASPKPVISSEQLKSKLIARVKQHKKEETASIIASEKAATKAMKSAVSTRVKKPSSYKEQADGDEFSKSLDFFSELSQRKKNEPKIASTALNKSIKNPNSVRSPPVNVDLPLELMEIMFDDKQPNTPSSSSSSSSSFSNQNNLSSLAIPQVVPPLKLNYVVDNIIPGCLKGGLKPTYKSLKRLHSPAPTSTPPTMNNPNNNEQLFVQRVEEPIEREDRLNKIKQKMQQSTLAKPVLNDVLPDSLPDSLPESLPDLESEENILKEEFKRSTAKRNDINALLTESPIQIETNNDGEKAKGEDVLSILYPIKNKKTTLRTTKRSYTVGRNKNGKTVGILVKDAHTRKKVMAAHKELKKTPINDIKKYLREHNLIKAGCSAPNDVLRKTYESVMFTGEVINTNEETLLHNFVNQPSN